MGGNSGYNGDVAERSRSTEVQYFQAAPKEVVKKLSISKLQNPKKLIRECLDSEFHPETTPIVVVMDVTLSRLKDIAILYSKLPMFMGEIYMRNYVPHPQISFAAVGDATNNDAFPIQIGEFESDNLLDDSLQAIILENGGGGGTGQESYQLMAYFYANHSKLDANLRGKKGYLFFIGDEGFYPKVSKNEVEKIFGEKIDNDLDSIEVFKKLQEKYHVFFIYPQKKWEDRKQGIDAEIRDRVKKAGGMYEGVDIRASLIWNNRHDLDLHCITPAGQHIYYGEKDSNCGGSLDVDRNARSDNLTSKPVENIRWPKGKAKKGHYRFFVENYAYHVDPAIDNPFAVEVEINGKIQQFELTMPAGITGSSSRVDVISFDYDPDKREIKEANYSAYDDAFIKNQWASVIPSSHIITISDPKAVVDSLLGVLALTNDITLDEYVHHMAGRDQSQARQDEIRNALSEMSTNYSLEKVDLTGLFATSTQTDRATKTKRL